MSLQDDLKVYAALDARRASHKEREQEFMRRVWKRWFEVATPVFYVLLLLSILVVAYLDFAHHLDTDADRYHVLKVLACIVLGIPNMVGSAASWVRMRELRAALDLSAAERRNLAKNNKIKVRLRNGKTGTVNAEDFDPATMEKV